MSQEPKNETMIRGFERLLAELRKNSETEEERRKRWASQHLEIERELADLAERNDGDVASPQLRAILRTGERVTG